MCTRQLKVLSIFVALLFIQSCSHPIEIEGQGDVTSASGNRNCSLEEFQTGQDKCKKNYAIGAYQETYYAIPRAGWKFDHWGNYCSNATPPNFDCSFNITADVVRQVWGQTMPPLKAVFTPVVPVDTDGDGLNDGVDPCPANPTNPCELITANDTIQANGKIWAQPVLFPRTPWSSINIVCPAGVCGAGATVRGYDVAGWKWASNADVVELFKSYGMPTPIGEVLYASTASWANAVLSAGWRPLYGPGPAPYYYWLLDGVTSNDNGGDAGGAASFSTSIVASEGYTCAATFISFPGEQCNTFAAGGIYKPLADPTIGAWFYKDVAP